MNKKNFKKLYSFICIIVLFVSVHVGLRYVLVDDTSSYTRIMMHQLYNSEKNIDIIFVGSSHVYRSLIPEVTDDGFNAYTFNCGTSAQYLDGSLAMINEVIEENDVNTIYLELFFGIAEGPRYKDRTEMTSTYIISDYMKPSIRKTQYLLRASSRDYWVNSFLPERRYWEKMFDIDYMMDLVTRKQNKSYKDYEWLKKENDNEYYVDRGFVANDTIADDVTWIQMANSKINIESIPNDWNESLEQIVNVCRGRDINLVFFIAPMPEGSIVSKGNYDDYHCYLQEKAEELGIEFIDFNLLANNQYFSSSDNKYFKDEDHLNTLGAEAFSRVFCNVLTNSGNEFFFYNSLAEKLKDQKPYVYGVSELIENQDNATKKGSVIANKKDGIEYKIEVIPDGDVMRVLQNFSEESSFCLPINEHGVLRITYRTAGQINFSTIELLY